MTSLTRKSVSACDTQGLTLLGRRQISNASPRVGHSVTVSPPPLSSTGGTPTRGAPVPGKDVSGTVQTGAPTRGAVDHYCIPKDPFKVRTLAEKEKGRIRWEKRLYRRAKMEEMREAVAQNKEKILEAAEATHFPDSFCSPQEVIDSLICPSDTVTGDQSPRDKSSRDKSHTGVAPRDGDSVGTSGRVVATPGEFIQEGDIAGIIRRYVAIALHGNLYDRDTVPAIRFFCEKFIPKISHKKLNVELPSLTRLEDVLESMSRIINAMSRGEISPAQAKDAMEVLEVARNMFEGVDLVKRVQNLEESIS